VVVGIHGSTIADELAEDTPGFVAPQTKRPWATAN
jgi:hypothetical protein